MPIDSQRMAEVLDVYPALDRLPAESRRMLADQCGAAGAAAGRVVFEAQDFARDYPLLLQGVARVLKIGASSRDTLLYRLRAGEHCLLSAAGLLARWRFAARVIAETDIRAVVIPGSLFRRLVRESADFSHSIHVAMARRLEIVMDLVEQATYFRLDQRVAAVLLARGNRLAVTHQELADDLGSSRENVSRVLEGFRRSGWVVLGRKRIEIADPTGVESVLGD